ncbi:MAG: hypothetical protein HYX24_04090 [Candidatus Aenigmarchaeota archaeon]|nr:hypothetical protein [Candidatus Aenigmarchaeota archaeon]
MNRPGCDIKKLSGQKYVYRLRVGDCRFVYVAEGNIVYIMEALQKREGAIDSCPNLLKAC